MLPHPCLLGYLKKKRDKIGSCSLTPAFSGAPKGAQMLPHPCILRDHQTKGDKIRIG